MFVALTTLPALSRIPAWPVLRLKDKEGPGVGPGHSLPSGLSGLLYQPANLA